MNGLPSLDRRGESSLDCRGESGIRPQNIRTGAAGTAVGDHKDRPY
jgi:hypothetical protein